MKCFGLGIKLLKAAESSEETVATGVCRLFHLQTPFIRSLGLGWENLTPISFK